jgi:hypothetical protein
LVHCDGTISHQYLKICKEHKCNVVDKKPGDRLGIDVEYFFEAYNCLYELSTKLTHTLWRKLLKDDLEAADDHLMSLTYDLLESKSFRIADTLLEFACTQKSIFDDTTRSIYIINSALSKYLQNDKEYAKKILDTKDWSSCSYPLKLAQKIILDDFECAYFYMEKIGDKGEVNDSQYKEWPLFSRIRNEVKFKKLYKKIFKEDYKVFERPKKAVHDILSKRLNAKKRKSKIKELDANAVKTESIN